MNEEALLKELADVERGASKEIDDVLYVRTDVPYREHEHQWEEVAPEGETRCAACSVCRNGRMLLASEYVEDGKIKER